MGDIKWYLKLQVIIIIIKVNCCRFLTYHIDLNIIFYMNYLSLIDDKLSCVCIMYKSFLSLQVGIDSICEHLSIILSIFWGYKVIDTKNRRTLF